MCVKLSTYVLLRMNYYVRKLHLLYCYVLHEQQFYVCEKNPQKYV